MPVVIVEMWKGRTNEQRKKLVEGITAAFASIGTRTDTVQIILKENEKDHWAQNGKLCSEL